MRVMADVAPPTSVINIPPFNPGPRVTASLKCGVSVGPINDLLGTLVMGRGSVQWWPSGNRVHALKKSWKSFAAMLDEHM